MEVKIKGDGKCNIEVAKDMVVIKVIKGQGKIIVESDGEKKVI